MSGVQILTAGDAQPHDHHVALLAEQIVRVAELAAGARGHARDKSGRQDQNPAIGIRHLEGTKDHLVVAWARLPIPGREEGAWELVERIIAPDGTLLKDELEEYLDRAASHEGGS